TEEADLVLGAYVLPERVGDKWCGYTWKSITVLGITENTIATNITISPNPTDGTTTLALELLSAGNLKITIEDLLGAELLELYNALECEGEFIKTFSFEQLPAGVYFLKIKHNGNTRIEKIIKN
ncbi:MAG: T9SS type A sorting domain-containing protein, partial [Bacteroidetes bacterium]|nr:T9SS type A sorting domain-containing protein [Bacteroidota bacterium]